MTVDPKAARPEAGVVVQIMPGDVVNVRVIGPEEKATEVLERLVEDSAIAEHLTAIPAVEARSGGSFGVVEVVQDLVVGYGVELTGAALSAAVHAVVNRLRRRRDGEPVTADDEITVSVRGEGVTEVVVRLRSDG